jgi:hypothetical protein
MTNHALLHSPRAKRRTGGGGEQAAVIMAHFHMHLRMGSELRPDIDGMDLPDLNAVMHVIRLAATDAAQSPVLSYDRFEVTDDFGRLLAIVPVASLTEALH